MYTSVRDAILILRFCQLASFILGLSYVFPILIVCLCYNVYLEVFFTIMLMLECHVELTLVNPWTVIGEMIGNFSSCCCFQLCPSVLILQPSPHLWLLSIISGFLGIQYLFSCSTYSGAFLKLSMPTFTHIPRKFPWNVWKWVLLLACHEHIFFTSQVNIPISRTPNLAKKECLILSLPPHVSSLIL